MNCEEETGFQFPELAPDLKRCVGWTADAGVEYAFAPNWTARIEYLYVDLGKFEFNGTASNNGNPVRADIKTNFHLVRGGVNLRW